MTKKCNTCLQILPKEDFNRRVRGPDGRQSVCRVCQHKRDASLYKENRSFRKEQIKQRRQEVGRKLKLIIGEAKAGKACLDCGISNLHPCQMDFDHIVGPKEFDISKAANLCVSEDALLNEMQKCQLVCANCHRLRTFNRINGRLG